ncbi:MAG TPA: SpoIIE family protein phosphatase [Bacilli bacterium]|nr:SpoIIE family protein phosphatase [Bacilli bacterium]
MAPLHEHGGDGYVVRKWEDRTLILVADALGHGTKAQETTTILLDLVQATPPVQLRKLLLGCHHMMRPTRGAAAAFVIIDHQSRTVTYSGIGNIALYHATARDGVTASKRMVRGILGYRQIVPTETTFPYQAGDRLLLFTDGVNTAAAKGRDVWHPQIQQGAQALLDRYASGQDDALLLLAEFDASTDIEWTET